MNRLYNENYKFSHRLKSITEINPTKLWNRKKYLPKSEICLTYKEPQRGNLRIHNTGNKSYFFMTKTECEMYRINIYNKS